MLVKELYLGSSTKSVELPKEYQNSQSVPSSARLLRSLIRINSKLTMCVKSYQHYSKCDHVFSILTMCPTHHKEQDSAKGFFGSLFRRSVRKKKNCGKVVPSHVTSESYCQACSVKKDHLRAKGVGQGALRVHRQGVEENFRDERKRAAKSSLQKAEKHRYRRKESNHEVIHVQTSVWLHDLYHHPETLAKKEAYARAAAPAPPVSSHTPKGSRPRMIDLSWRGRTQEGCEEETRMTERTRPQVSPQWTPAYGGSQPMMRPVRPAPTYQYSSHSAYNGPSLPPAVGVPPLPQRDNRSYMQAVPAKPQVTKRPELRHKTGRVYNSKKSRNQPPVPLYQAHLDAMATNAKLEAMQAMRQANTPAKLSHAPSAGTWAEEPSRWDTGKPTISSWIDRTKERATSSDNDSDVSFVCRSARAISNQPRTAGAKHRSRK
ncbi:hypothetical protein HD806DRAFT_171992 [Xylariaceae sp. AK1471]|nr:hypothetical protein HD806DRAFT_171992 [Xylariaceae sp. AK1471]